MIENLTSTHKIRNNRKQKRAFLEYAKKEFEELGYNAQIQQGKTMGIRCENLVVGDVYKASIIVGAHYDTPRTALLPIRTYLNRVGVSIFFQLLPILVTFAVIYAVNFFVDMPVWANFIIGYLVVYLLMFCLKNKNNANDNSSGVYGVYETARMLGSEHRAKVAFVLFDNEEWGMLGALAFAAEYETRNRFVLVMDCIGVGEPAVVYKSADEIQARKLAGGELRVEKEKTNLYMSDNKVFSRALLVSAFKKDGIGYYLDKIHTNADKECSVTNVQIVAGNTVRFIEKS